MSQILSYQKITAARDSISDIYNYAERNLVVDITRGDDAPIAVLRKDLLVTLLQARCVFEPKVHFSEEGYVSMWLEGLPISAQGASLEVAEFELIRSLRDFSQTWMDDLREYPNHRDNWQLPALVRLTTDDQLHQLVFGNE